MCRIRAAAEIAPTLSSTLVSRRRRMPNSSTSPPSPLSRPRDPAQIAEYLRVRHELDPNIPLYNLAGQSRCGECPNSGESGGESQGLWQRLLHLSKRQRGGIVI
jgi:hypothetical protein